MKQLLCGSLFAQAHLVSEEFARSSDSVMSMIADVNNRLNGHFGAFYGHVANSKKSFFCEPVRDENGCLFLVISNN